MKHVTEEWDNPVIQKRWMRDVGVRLTQTEIAEIISVNQGTVSRMTDQSITLKQFVEISREIGVDPRNYINPK